MEASMGVIFPNESPDYRGARNKLLQREVALRREMEAVAAEVRALPPGGPVPEDYEFDHIDANGEPAKVRLAELRSEEHTSELQSLMRISYADFCLKKKK